MSPFNRLKETLKNLQDKDCEADSTVKDFVQEYEKQAKNAVQKLNKEHSKDLEDCQNSSK
jgi:hypothetical protein